MKGWSTVNASRSCRGSRQLLKQMCRSPAAVVTGDEGSRLSGKAIVTRLCIRCAQTQASLGIPKMYIDLFAQTHTDGSAVSNHASRLYLKTGLGLVVRVFACRMN